MEAPEESIFSFEDLEKVAAPEVETEAPAAKAEEPSVSEKEQLRRAEQSRADRLQAELDAIKAREDDLKRYEGVARLLEDERYLSAIEQVISQNGGQAQPTRTADVPQAVPLPEMPTEPERPLSYNPDDAANDPQSESYAYRVREEKYLRDMVKWNAQVLSAQQQNAVAQQKAQEEQAQRARAFRSQVERAAKYADIPADRVEEFYRFAASITPEDEERAIGQYFVRKHMPSAEEIANQRRADELKLQAEAANLPVPASAAGGGAAVEETVEDDSFHFGSDGGGRMI